MLVRIEMLEDEIRKAINEYIERQYNVCVDAKGLDIEVKSKQNYRSEWESAAIRLNASLTAISE